MWQETPRQLTPAVREDSFAAQSIGVLVNSGNAEVAGAILGDGHAVDAECG